jgi:hypothetical protein
VARYAHDKKDLAGHLRHNGIDLAEYLGPVRFTGPHTVRAEDGRSWRADRIVIAVGCRAARLPVPGGELALSYQDIWTLKALPRHRHRAIPARLELPRVRRMSLRRPARPPSRIVPVLGAPVLYPLAGARRLPPPEEQPVPPAVDHLHPAHVVAAGPPGEPQEEGVQARIGAGQLALHAAKDPQLTSTQAHDGMLPSAALWRPPPAGVK